MTPQEQVEAMRAAVRAKLQEFGGQSLTPATLHTLQQAIIEALREYTAGGVTGHVLDAMGLSLQHGLPLSTLYDLSARLALDPDNPSHGKLHFTAKPLQATDAVCQITDYPNLSPEAWRTELHDCLTAAAQLRTPQDRLPTLAELAELSKTLSQLAQQFVTPGGFSTARMSELGYDVSEAWEDDRWTLTVTMTQAQDSLCMHIQPVLVADPEQHTDVFTRRAQINQLVLEELHRLPRDPSLETRGNWELYVTQRLRKLAMPDGLSEECVHALALECPGEPGQRYQLQAKLYSHGGFWTVSLSAILWSDPASN